MISNKVNKKSRKPKIKHIQAGDYFVTDTPSLCDILVYLDTDGMVKLMNADSFRTMKCTSALEYLNNHGYYSVDVEVVEVKSAGCMMFKD